MGQAASLPPNGNYTGNGDITVLKCNNPKQKIYSSIINLKRIEDELCNKYIIKIVNKYFKINLLGMINNELFSTHITIFDKDIFHVFYYQVLNDTTGIITHNYNGNYKKLHITGCEKYTIKLK